MTDEQQPAAAPAPAPQPTNQVSLWAMITGIASWVLWFIPAPFSVAAIVLGHVGLVQTKGQKGSNRGFAIAGLALGYAFIGIFVVIFGSMLLLWLTGGMAGMSWDSVDEGMMYP